jgi:hypothetical protein
MSEQSPYEKLGVNETASFEEIQEAKERLRQQSHNDSKVIEGVEAAYDAIIMERLRLRQEGKIKVPERIRFPEKSPEVLPNPNPVLSPPTLNWLGRLLDTPSKTEILWSSVVFFLLIGITLFAQSTESSLLSLLIALGFAANIYFLNRKEGRFGRAFVISLISLIVGVGLGTLLSGLLGIPRNEIPLNSEQISSVLTFLLFWITSSFLR